MDDYEASDDFRAPVTAPGKNVKMQRVAFSVAMTVPEDADLNAMAGDIRSSIEFGDELRVSLQYVIGDLV